MVSINLDFKAHNHLNIHPQGLMSLSLSSHLGTVHIPCFLSPLVLQHTTTTQIQMSLSSTTPFSHSLQLIHPHTHLSSLPASSSSSIIFSPLQISRHRHKASRFTINASSTPPPTTTTKPTQSFRTKSPKDVNVLVTGSTGYIGKFVVRELCRRGFNVIAVSRERSGVRGRDDKARAAQKLAGSTVCFADVTDPDSLGRALEPLPRPVDAVVCCLASRGGGISDSWKVDYGASRNSLLAGRRLGASHFVLLSAICVQKPLLAFQRAKLKFEGELAEEAARDPGFTYSIVRPTAFFKSLGGQVETVKDGKPYVMFGDGRLCACKPISEADLASFIVDCVLDEDKACKVLPIGGPGKALTPLEQGELLFKLLGRESKFLKVPIEVMDFVIGVLDFLAKVFPSLEDAAEFGKIGRYYAAESMLALDPETGEYSAEKTPSYGKDTLEEFFARVIREGMAGQELGEQTIF